MGIGFLLLAALCRLRGVRSLRGREEPQASPVGIAVTALSIAVMLWLTRAKRRTGEALGSSALVADA